MIVRGHARRLVRFRDEALAAASLRHGHIAPVYAVGCERGVHFYAMQLINGQTLARLISERRGGKPATQQAAPTTISRPPRTGPRLRTGRCGEAVRRDGD